MTLLGVKTLSELGPQFVSVLLEPSPSNKLVSC